MAPCQREAVSRLSPDAWLAALEELNVRSFPDSEVVLLTQVCARHVPHYLFAATSFLWFSGLRTRVIVCCDDDISASDRSVISARVSGVQFLEREELLERYGFKYPRLSEFCRNNVFGRRLLAAGLMGEQKSLIFLDSDVLFFRQPAEILMWVRGEVKFDALYMRDPEREQSVNAGVGQFGALQSSFVPNFNAGLFCVKGNVSDLAYFEWVLGEIEATPFVRCCSWVAEQTLWALALGRTKSRRLPASYCFDEGDFHIKRSVAVHYSTRKSRFFSSGVDRFISSTRK